MQQIRNTHFEGERPLFATHNLQLENVTIHTGESALKECSNIEAVNCRFEGKYPFWNTENVTIYDSKLNGEYLGWHSKNLRLVNCHISGTQALCFAHDLVMENCTMDDSADLCFEHSTLQAQINSPVHSVKNPRSGVITAQSYGEIIIDDNCRAPRNCELKLWDNQTCFN